MTALTLRVIQKNPPVTLHEILKTPLMHGHFHIAAKFTFISREGTSYFNEWEVHFQWGIHFQVERAPHWGCICLDDGGGGWWTKKFMEQEAPQSCLSPLGQTLVCVVTGLKRNMNYNILWKIYKSSILTLQEKALLHR